MRTEKRLPGLSLIIFLIVLFQYSTASAQLTADFNTDNAGGCSPLTIQLTNTTTGASPTASWTWDFGNGNMSVEKNPAAVFIGAKSYTITLTVKDGDKVSVKTKSVTVYASPEIDFSFDPSKGCMPLEVNFTAQQKGGDGKVSTWTWDFGDGTTSQDSVNITKHTYHFRQSASVSLTALSNYGCAGTIVKEKIIEVKDSARADFSADNTLFCNANATVTFTNNSAGAGTLTYKWDFGDGNTSTSTSPVHTYKRNGKFTVSLIVISSEGCSVSTVKKEYIAIGNLISDFSVPDLTCEKKELVFRNTSFPKPMKSTWYVDGIAASVFTDSTLTHSFTSAGTHTIRLVNQYANCSLDVSKQITLLSRPPLDTFIVEMPTFCEAPVDGIFRDTTAGAVKWRWDVKSGPYGGILDSNRGQNAIFKFGYHGDYMINLEVENAEGCVSTISKYIHLKPVSVHVNKVGSEPDRGCDSIIKTFRAVSSDSIVNYMWDFGDGNTSPEAGPTHTYKGNGIYQPKLKYTTLHGCTGYAETPFTVRLFDKPVADFEVPEEVCGRNIVQVLPKVQGNDPTLFLDWGDGSRNVFFTSHQYNSPGEYTITLVASIGRCRDTMVKKNIIKVKGPFAKIHRVDYSCEGERNVVTIIDSSTHIKKWNWDFDDGTTDSYTEHKPVFTHTFENSSNYMVRLTAERDGCIQKDSVLVHILKKQKPELRFEREFICLNDGNNYQVTNLEENTYLFSDRNARYIFESFDFKNGQPYTGIHDYPFWTWYRELNGIVKPKEAVSDSIRMIITSYFHGCQDTTNYVPFVVKGVSTAFDIVKDDQCLNNPVLFKDQSKSIGGNSIVNRLWEFGDGKQIITTNPGNISHEYSDPGLYEVRLTVDDASGCSSSITNASRPVRVKGPKAGFYVSPGLLVNEGTEVSFINKTNTSFATGEVSYLWIFGDGQTSELENPVHKFQSKGKFTVLLVATDAGTSCQDTSRVTIVHGDIPTGTSFSTSSTYLGDNGGCPPLKVSAFYISNLPYTRLSWDFGDGFSIEGQTTPSHIYTIPGTYFLTLTVYDGTIITGRYRDTIEMKIPAANLHTPANAICRGNELLMHSPGPNNGYTYTWDIGNGTVITGMDSMVKYQYDLPGTYQVSLIVRDKSGCSSAAVLPEKVTVFPNPVISVNPVSAMVCSGLGIQLEASGALTYQWSPSTGLNDANIAKPIASPSTNTNYTVKGIDENGCSSQSQVQVTVPPSIKLTSTQAVEICAGEGIILSVSGADRYQWVGDVKGLSSTNDANPTAKPPITTTYTVVGTDPFNCYRDTAEITVYVRPLPTVSLGQDQLVGNGMPVTLQSNTSPDVVRWEWSPTTYLNCSNCPAPVSTPLSDITYALTVSNSYECRATDTIILKTFCSGNKIHIPNTFTPNGDGLNDVFRIPPNGISRVIYFRIYNSWGEIIFEHRNFTPGDPAGNWTGKFRGQNLPTGTYIYATEVECSPEKKYQYKGTVTLLR